MTREQFWCDAFLRVWEHHDNQQLAALEADRMLMEYDWRWQVRPPLVATNDE